MAPAESELNRLDTTLETEASWIDGLAIRPVFQPILDLASGVPMGFEVLSREELRGEPPELFFQRAKADGLLWELERVCWDAALRRIAQLGSACRGAKFFLNVSPQVLSDPRFAAALAPGALRSLGIEAGELVLEITEKDSVPDGGAFEAAVRLAVGQGFQIALDDFGSGHSGLISLVRSRPHFVKLDQAVVRDVGQISYKQHLVRALAAFSASVGATLIAEGVETWSELEALLRLGVRYAQGFLFARPHAEPPRPAPEVRDHLARLERTARPWESHAEESLEALIGDCVTIEAGALSVENLDRLFRHTPAADHVVIVRERRPVGLMPRIYFYARTAGPFGYPVFQKKPVDVLAKRNPLAVEEATRVTDLYRLAMGRPPEDVYDPVVVTDRQGNLLGTVTIRQLIQRSTELELQWATGANPLTGLPGNRMIQHWIREALAMPEFSIVYADLDRFKEYNDAYGFLLGDEMLRVTARVLAQGAHGLSSGVRLGHVGGDDFVIVCLGLVSEDALAEICCGFDAVRRDLFDPIDRERGFFQAADRRRQVAAVPLVTLSLAVVDSRSLAHAGDLAGDPDPARLSRVVASLKAAAKVLTERLRRSAFLFDHQAIQLA